MRLEKDFFERTPEEVACDLLNSYVVREDAGQIKAMITETEAYRGRGRSDTGTMSEEAGTFYIYNLRGNPTLNITTGEEGDPECVLVREVEIDGQKYGPIQTADELDIGWDWDGENVSGEGLYFDDGIFHEEVLNQENCAGRWSLEG
ncbi:MAG: DNA-3-methyladenine glycosylase [Candidatus Nanohaloarchaea archaeon]